MYAGGITLRGWFKAKKIIMKAKPRMDGVIFGR